MLKLIFAFWLAAGSAVLSRAEGSNSVPVIPAAKAGEHIGSTRVVTGVVSEVYMTDKLWRLNFDDRFPRQTFTAVIFAAKTNLFPKVAELKGKNVAVEGKIAEYREKPQIVLLSTNQLRVLEGESK